ncbi:hypothetical protein GCM10010365_21200 [Streptomyces poonensis]|uniref:Uncharacterized protein n=1 Tax=Streptomyces poonensis TaxID=68255 RepID=A0A918PDZ4_9ACTN|nr:hypothetical protein GCM10010365_21200 [Streptomyces poonensis]GLJ93527.1 hypothetical protein GCM10017589_61410 [Streptomyces poonensis]
MDREDETGVGAGECLLEGLREGGEEGSKVRRLVVPRDLSRELVGGQRKLGPAQRGGVRAEGAALDDDRPVVGVERDRYGVGREIAFPTSADHDRSVKGLDRGLLAGRRC